MGSQNKVISAFAAIFFFLLQSHNGRRAEDVEGLERVGVPVGGGHGVLRQQQPQQQQQPESNLGQISIDNVLR